LVKQFGCEPLSVPGAEAALALLRHEPPIDLILLDLDLPDMDGVVAAQLIRTLGARSTLPIIAVTDDPDRLEAPRARAAGFTGAVVKPYSPRELHATMEAAFARATAEAPVLGHA
jgi:CheY-like chemotaxis protein